MEHGGRAAVQDMAREMGISEVEVLAIAHGLQGRRVPGTNVYTI